jgi:hypothetical protein
MLQDMQTTPVIDLLCHNVRLLKLAAGTENDPVECDLVHVDLSTHPDYEALSYAWGPMVMRS